MKDHFARIARFYDCLIPVQDTGRLGTLLRLPVRGFVLDTGGGTGRASGNLEKQCRNIVITDLSRPMLAKARTRGFKNLVQSRAEHLPYACNTFERIIVADALHHFTDQYSSITELLRVLKPGGRLVIKEPNIENPFIKLIGLMEKGLLMKSLINNYRDIQKMISKAGYESDVLKDDRLFIWITVDK